MKDYTVKTIHGSMESRSKCVRFKGKYYVRNTDIFRIPQTERGVKWLTKSDKNLVYDVDNKVHKHKDYCDGYRTLTTTIPTVSRIFDCNMHEAFIDEQYCLSTKTYAEANLKLDTTSGIYTKKGSSSPDTLRSLMYRNIQYNYEQNQFIFEKFKEKLSSSIDILSQGYTYGLELETSKGMIPSNKLLTHGLMPLRDGSISGYEYVTPPITKLATAINAVEIVNKYCKFDITTSFHVHIGGAPTTKAYIIRFYKLMELIQNDVFKMFPKYKYEDTFGIKRRNYTRPLPKKIRFNTILNYLNNGRVCEQEYTGDHLVHSADRYRTNKWYLSNRYSWVNLIPLIFYPSRTIEFRIHQGSLNKYKIGYWILMCTAFVKYTESLTNNSVQHVGLDTIFNTVYPTGNTAAALLAHYEYMKNYYINYNEGKDPGYLQDIKDDASYEPTIKLY